MEHVNLNQIVTYMGNKRKLLRQIDDVVTCVLEELGNPHPVIAELFSGSGVVSRLLLTHAHELHVNDIAPFAEALSECYLPSQTPSERQATEAAIVEANTFVDTVSRTDVPQWVQRYWTCEDEDNVQPGERLYYTPQNAFRIDAYRHYIVSRCPEALRPRLLGPLLHECSVHTNTNGNFSGFYRAEGARPWGGQRHIDERRITQQIRLSAPCTPSAPLEGGVHVTRGDAASVAASLPPLDLVYIDPPYNKHPYATYYFMLDIIAAWDTTLAIPDTMRGQPKDWARSDYNSFTKAKNAMEDLLDSITAKVVIISYNNRGIISEDEMRALLERHGTVERVDLTHRTYNKMQGIAAKKRTQASVATVEYLWILRCQ